MNTKQRLLATVKAIYKIMSYIKTIRLIKHQVFNIFQIIISSNGFENMLVRNETVLFLDRLISSVSLE